MDLELPKSYCLQEIRWCVWLWRDFEDRYPLKNNEIQPLTMKKIKLGLHLHTNHASMNKIIPLGLRLTF